MNMSYVIAILALLMIPIGLATGRSRGRARPIAIIAIFVVSLLLTVLLFALLAWANHCPQDVGCNEFFNRPLF